MKALLRGALASSAYETLDGASRAYLGLKPKDVEEGSLAKGSAGIALTHAYLARVFPKRGHEAAASLMLRHAFGAAAKRALDSSLMAGFTGIAWVVEHLAGDAAGERNAQIDDALESALGGAVWRRPYGLARGLAGIAVYALEAAPRDAAIAILARVVEHLSATAQRAPDGVAWINEPRWSAGSPGSTGSKRLRPHFDLGVSDGLAGVIPVLAASASLGVEAKEARALLDKSVRWLLAQRLPARGIGRFPRALGRDFSDEPAALGWQEGDLGVASVLLVAARALGVRTWEKQAISLALHAAKRTASNAGIRDAAFANGASGAAHLFHRFYRLTRDARFAEAARTWFSLALDCRTGDPDAFAGFATFAWNRGGTAKRRRTSEWLRDPSLLVGAAGTTLTLVTALADDPVFFAWDRAFIPRSKSSP